MSFNDVGASMPNSDGNTNNTQMMVILLNRFGELCDKRW